MSIIINEIFYSIQGESLHWGRPCTFVRLAGCNLRCTYCDTQYAYDEGTKMTIGEIIDAVGRFDCNLVEITGGEPLIQEKTPELIKTLIDSGCEVLLETNGSRDIGKIESGCVKILDIKCPSSNESSKNNLNNLNKLTSDDQVKFVLQNNEDYEFAKSMIARLPGDFPGHHVLFSPVTDKLLPSILAKWILEDHLSARLQLQLHKIIWPDIDRGV